MRVFERTALPVALDDDGIALAQQLVGAGNLTLTAGAASLVPPRNVTLTSAGNLSAVTYTIYGTDRAGASISESIAGPNANTVTSVYVYASVTRIAASAANGTDITAGFGLGGYSPWMPLGQGFKGSTFNIRVFRSSTTGTVLYDVEVCSTLVNMRNNLPINGSRVPGIVGDLADDTAVVAAAQSTDSWTPLLVPYAAIRIKNNGTGTLKLRAVAGFSG